MKNKLHLLVILVFTFSSCSNSTKNENDKSNMVFIEDTVSGEFKEESEDFLPSDSVGVKDPKTGEYIMMTYEEAEKITESEKK